MDTDQAVKWIAIGCGLMFAALVVGCAEAGRDQTGVKAEIKGFEARVATKFDNTRKIVARDIKQVNDAVTMRILAVGAVLMGLTYPIGKIIYCLGQQFTAKTYRKVQGAIQWRKIRRKN